MVTMLKPNTISTAFGLAKLQGEEVARRKGGTSRNQSPTQTTFPYMPKLPAPAPLMRLPSPPPRPENRNNPTTYNPNQKPTFPIKRISHSQMQEGREKGLCYYCDEKFNFNYKCSRPRIFLLEALEDEEEEEAETSEGKLALIQLDKHAKEENELGELLGISLHAMAGTLSPKTMRVEGFINHQNVLILVDTGSMHSFVDPYVARRSKLQVEESQLIVKVANGDSFPCQGYCRAVPIQLQNLRVKTNLCLLTLGGCDVVLGVNWLRGLGFILWNFTDLTMQFNFRGNECKLLGLQPPRESLEEEEHVPKLKKGVVKGVWLYLIGREVRTTEEVSIPAVSKIVKDFEAVFSEPHGLPPPRSHDHKIVLQEDLKSTCVWIYIYPYYQKAKIERLVTKMLRSGIIRGSQSPYSSPVLLVRKVDRSWRMCVDYRALNKDTIKDKYHIPNIDELLDEFYGAEIFSKLDLRSGYHQIRMHEGDISKTTFRTHEGYYEFLQSLEDHLQHLQIVLDTLRSHQLFAKQSKFVFGCSKVEYLGHLISKDGVKADPHNITAMQSWPLLRNLKALRGFLGLTGYYRKFV
ncbi:hypothetical protein F2P56_034120 [Juglans regia]|nr:hypothetical protein F2P56_034120 [Juglans regia]